MPLKQIYGRTRPNYITSPRHPRGLFAELLTPGDIPFQLTKVNKQCAISSLPTNCKHAILPAVKPFYSRLTKSVILTPCFGINSRPVFTRRAASKQSMLLNHGPATKTASTKLSLSCAKTTPAIIFTFPYIPRNHHFRIFKPEKALMLRQTQQQKLLQKLSPQQIQLMKLLQIPTANLEERIKEEMEENPALELGAEANDDEYNLDGDKEEEYEADDVELSSDDTENIDLDDFLRGEDEGGGGDYSDYYSGQDNERPESPVRVETSFHDHLLVQLGMLGLEEDKQIIAEQVIGSLDEDGYLRREPLALVDDLAFSSGMETTEEEVLEVIGMIQQFDPPGVAARSLEECLRLQLERIEPRTKPVTAAIRVIDKYFNEFIKKHYDKIQKHLDLDNEEFKEVINLILKLNPKPGSAFAVVSKAESYILPDFFIYNNNGKLELSLNARNAPELRVSEGYREMMQAYDRGDKKDKRQKEALMFIKQKLDSAKWFIDAIKQRQHTLLQTMQAIIEFQRQFFLTGDETTLRPMILKDIAEITALDVSTVSRVANSKYVQTEFGTFKLKYFFSEALKNDDGEEVSTREVKNILNDIIKNENKRKPYSDEKLTNMLQEKGYNIARRTVAKYREQLNIPVARLRKEL